MNLSLVHLRVPKRLLYRFESASEHIGAEFFEPGPGDRRVEVDALEQRVDLNARLRRRAQGSLRPLAGGPQASKGPLVGAQVLLVLPLEFLHEVVHHSIVEVFATEMRVAGRGFHLEDAILDRQNRHVEGTTAQVEDQDVLLARGLLIKTVGYRGGRGLVYYPEDIQASDSAGILRRLPLGVIEISWHGNNGVCYGVAQVRLRSLLHLYQNHRGHLLGEESLHLALVGYLDLRFAAVVHHRERPVLHVALHRRIVETTTDQALRVFRGKKKF